MQGVPPAHPAFLYCIPFRHRAYALRFIGLAPYAIWGVALRAIGWCAISYHRAYALR